MEYYQAILRQGATWMMSKTDDMIAAKKIKSLSANIAGQLVLPEIDIKNWMKKLFPILLDFHAQYGNRQYVFIIDKSLSAEELQLLSTEILWNLIS